MWDTLLSATRPSHLFMIAVVLVVSPALEPLLVSLAIAVAGASAVGRKYPDLRCTCLVRFCRDTCDLIDLFFRHALCQRLRSQRKASRDRSLSSKTFA